MHFVAQSRLSHPSSEFTHELSPRPLQPLRLEPETYRHEQLRRELAPLFRNHDWRDIARVVHNQLTVSTLSLGHALQLARMADELDAAGRHHDALLMRVQASVADDAARCGTKALRDVVLEELRAMTLDRLVLELSNPLAYVRELAFLAVGEVDTAAGRAAGRVAA